MQDAMDLGIVVSADKDYRHALIQVREMGRIDLEVAVWQAIPGGRAVGRIELQPKRPSEPIDYRTQAPPPSWRGPS